MGSTYGWVNEVGWYGHANKVRWIHHLLSVMTFFSFTSGTHSPEVAAQYLRPSESGQLHDVYVCLQAMTASLWCPVYSWTSCNQHYSWTVQSISTVPSVYSWNMCLLTELLNLRRGAFSRYLSTELHTSTMQSFCRRMRLRYFLKHVWSCR